jgi:hypothetical protein
MIAAPQFSVGWRDISIAATGFFFYLRDPSIAASQLFQLAGTIPQVPFDCCFLALSLFAAIAPRPALRQPFGMILKPRANHLVQSSSLMLAIWRDP